MKRKFLKQALGLVICLSMVCPQVMVSAAPLQEMNVKTIQAEVQSTSDDGNEQVTKVAEEVTMKVNDTDATGATIEEAVTNSKVELGDITSLEFVSGNVTSDEFNTSGWLYKNKGNMKNLTSVVFKLSESMTLDGKSKDATLPANFLKSNIYVKNVELEGFTAIGASAFYGCTKLETINLSGIKSVGKQAFYNTTKLTKAIMPDVTELGTEAFSKSGITELEIGEGLTVIPSKAFYLCKSLKKIILPSTLEKIEASGLSLSTNTAADITLKSENPPEVVSNSISVHKDSSKIHIPDGCMKNYVPDMEKGKLYSPKSELPKWSGIDVKLYEDNTVYLTVNWKNVSTDYVNTAGIICADKGTAIGDVVETPVQMNQHAFCGYYTTEGCTEGTEITKEWNVPDADATIWIKAELPVVTVHDYDGKGGVKPITIPAENYNKLNYKQNLMPEYPTNKDGITASMWNTEPDGSGTVVDGWTTFYVHTDIYPIYEEQTNVYVSINGEEATGSANLGLALDKALAKGDVTSVEITAGKVTGADLKKLYYVQSTLESLIIDEGVEVENKTIIGGTITNGPNLKYIELNGVEHLETTAFSYPAVETLILPDLQELDPSDINFKSTQSTLKTFEAPNLEVLNCRLDGQKDIEKIELKSVQEIGTNGYEIFKACSSLKEVYAPNLEKIGDKAFTGLSGVTISTNKMPEFTNGALGSNKNTIHLLDPAYAAKFIEEHGTNYNGVIITAEEAEAAVTAMVNGKAAEGESFQAAVEAAGINAADVETIEFQSGNVTSEDLAYIKENCEALETFKLNLTEELTFDEGATVLPSRAFEDMESLETVELGGFTELGSYSLAETKSLANVSIPDVVKVGPYAFRQVAYDADTGKGVALKSIDLPNVVTISNYAFSYCDALTEVNMPKVEKIDLKAFDCKNFTEIHLPATIKELSKDTFYHRNRGTKKEFHVTIASTEPPVITREGTPFTSASENSTLTVPEEALDAYMADTKWYDAEDHTWAGLKLPEQQTVVTANINGTSYSGASLEKAVAKADLTAEDVTSLTIESGKVTQDDLAYITTLTYLESFTMNLDNDLTLIGKDGEATTVLGPDTAELIFAGTPSGHSRACLETLVLGGVTEIYNGGVKSNSVESISLPDVEIVGADTFSTTFEWLEKVDLSSAKEIGERAFVKCVNLREVTLNSVEILKEGCFKGTNNLKKLTLPATLKTIENIGFGSELTSGNKNGTKITMLGTEPPTVANGAFKGVASSTTQSTVTVPAGALQNYLAQKDPKLDASGVLKIKETIWNNLYLKEEGSYRIAYDTGNSWETQYAFVKAGSALTEKQIPTANAEEGFEFVGWNTQENGSGDMLTVETVIDKDITVYPVFEEAVINVTALINGQSFGGETLEDAIAASGVKAGDVKSIKFVSGNVTKDDLTYIRDNCDDLESLALNLTEGLTYENDSTVLPMKAFTKMRYLKNVELGGFTEIGSRAFQNSGIVSISIPDVTVINSLAFQGCTALESVDMPKVERIGSDAFRETDSLTEVTLPASITSLNACGFASKASGSMSDFHLIMEKTTPPEIKGRVVEGEGTVTVPEGSLSAYLGETDFNKYFTSEGDIQWSGLTVVDPAYSMVTFHGTNAGQTAYAYVANDTAITEAQMPAFTQDGYVLAGWNTSENGSGEALNVGDTLDGNMDVYAQWEVEVKDTTAPTAQISTDGKLQNIDQEKPYNINISLKFHDDTALDYYVLNDKEKPTGITGAWGDGNYQNIKSYLNEGNGEEGKNTLTVYDKAGNSTTYTFYVDQTKPELVGEFVITPDNGQMSTSKTVTFTTSEPIQALEGWTEVADSNGTQWQKEFTENFKGEIKFTDIAGNESDAYKLEVKRIENVKPEAEITYSNNGQPTNQDVVVTVKTNVECQTPDGWERVPGSAKKNEFQKTYSENTTETVTFVSLSGVSAEFEINVTGIDKVAPVITDVAISPENSQMSTSKTVTITADEAVQCPGEGWTEVEGSDGTQWAKVYTEAKKDSITVTDIAGNVSEKASFEVKRIENIAPTAEVAYSNDGQPTNEDVTVIISTNVECNVPDGWERVPGSAKRNQFQKTYSENTEETITLTSLSGVTGSVVVTVTGIDKVAPEADVEYSTTEITSGSVIVTIRANEPIQTPEGWTKVDDVTFTKEYTHNVDRNVNIYDLAGNGNDVDIRITNIVQNKEVTVSYVDEATGETVGTETITVAGNAGTFSTNLLEKVPAGYEIVYVGDEMISAENTADVIVRKVVSMIDVEVSYIDEATGKEVGKETISVEEDSYQFNTSILQNIPQGYEIVNVGDTLINKDDNTAEVKVRIPADQAEAKLVIWWMDEWGIPLTDEDGEPWKMELTARGTEGEKHTFTKDDWELPEGYEYVSDTDKWLAEQDFIVKYGETLDTLSIAICPEGTSGVGR